MALNALIYLSFHSRAFLPVNPIASNENPSRLTRKQRYSFPREFTYVDSLNISLHKIVESDFNMLSISLKTWSCLLPNFSAISLLLATTCPFSSFKIISFIIFWFLLLLRNIFFRKGELVGNYPTKFSIAGVIGTYPIHSFHQ